MPTAIRNFELRNLGWHDVDLVGTVRRPRDSKTEPGERSIALSATASQALWQHRRGSASQGDDQHVFGHPERGSMPRPDWFAEELRAALEAAGIEATTRISLHLAGQAFRDRRTRSSRGCRAVELSIDLT